MTISTSNLKLELSKSSTTGYLLTQGLLYVKDDNVCSFIQIFLMYYLKKQPTTVIL